MDYSLKDVVDILLKSGFELFEINRFREEKTPKLNMVTEVDYHALIDIKEWTQRQRDNRRMLFATKESIDDIGIGN